MDTRNKIPKEIAEFIAIKRKKKNWTIQDLSDRCLVHPNTLRRLEKGFNVNAQVLIDVLRALHVTLPWEKGYEEVPNTDREDTSKDTAVFK